MRRTDSLEKTLMLGKHSRRDFNPWVRKIPWGGERLPTSVFWPGEFHGPYSPCGHKESDTTERLTFTFHFHTLEKEMATHSSVLAWRTPGTAEPGGLPSTGSHRVGAAANSEEANSKIHTPNQHVPPQRLYMDCKVRAKSDELQNRNLAKDPSPVSWRGKLGQSI